MPTQATSVDEAAKLISSSSNGRRNIDDAFWMCDVGDAAAHLRTWIKAMPRVRPFYAIKAAPFRPLVKMFLLKGTGLDCASQAEIDLGLSMGANPDDIVFSNTNKQISHLEYARKMNVKLTVYDSEHELHKIKKYYPEAEIMLRIKAFSENVTIDLNKRFGADASEWESLIKLAKDLGMKVVGICFHVGSGCYDKMAYSRALEDSRRLFDYGRTLGYNFTRLDIGGGFRGIEEERDAFYEFAKTINESLDTQFPEEEYRQLKIIAEPGKYFATSVFTLVTNVISRTDSKTGDQAIYTVNDGIYGSLQLQLRGILGTGECEPWVLCEGNRKLRSCRIDGGTCSGLDVICSSVTLPEAYVREWIAWKNSGSYTFAIASEFNGFGPGKFYVILTTKHRDLIDDNVMQEISTTVSSFHHN